MNHVEPDEWIHEYMSSSIRGMNADESGLMMWISTDEDECIATERGGSGSKWRG